MSENLGEATQQAQGRPPPRHAPREWFPADPSAADFQEGTAPAFKRADDLHVASMCRQHYDACFLELSAKGVYRIDAAHAGHWEVHQGDVRTVFTELLNRFPSTGGFGGETDVWLSGLGSGEPASEHGVIVNR